MKPINILYIAGLLLFACNSGPKVVEATAETTSAPSSGVFSEITSLDVPAGGNPATTGELHKVVVKESLPTARYVYLRVSEGGEDFWIATRKQEVQIGASYFYKGGLLKNRFESKEYNRVFDKIYLVSKLVPEQHGSHNHDHASTSEPSDRKATASRMPKIELVKGAVQIADLVKNPTQYAGKTVLVKGRCVKINPNIMNRNWIHLQDGSADDFDLVITSDSHVHEGEVVAMQAQVSLNKDFGAGYSYELILENGKVVR